MSQNKQIIEYLEKRMVKKQAKVANKEAFVWRKKIERDVMEGRVDSKALKKKRDLERLEEAEKVKKSREERDIARVKREEEKNLLARDRARAEDQEWEKKEEEFCLCQTRIRSEIRLRKGQPKPLDLLIKLIDDDLGKVKGVVVEPCKVCKHLDTKDLEELRDEVELQVSLDRGTQMHIDYWEAVLVVCEDFLNHANGFGGRGIHRMVQEDVERFLEGKSNQELEDLVSDIEANMESGNAMEVEFWEVVLERLSVYKAMAFLKEIYDKRMLDNKEPLEAGNGDENGEVDDKRPNFQGGFQDRSLTRMERMEEGGEVFGSVQEINLEQNVYSPRKPKYLNRVHTGYRWNKYNQTHYDYHNPPPKMVTGYEFNVFYPDLVDGSKVPTYWIEKDAESRENCIIRFHASPPYEDIAFRICNKEWEYSRKKGFKCTFDGRILCLHFRIKHYSYRK